MKVTLASVMTTGLMAISFFAGSAQAAWDLTKKNNLMVYWGQNAMNTEESARGQKRLIEYCKDSDVDLIAIAFVKNWKSVIDGRPEVNFANQCWQTFPDSQVNWCANISEDIISCQKDYGKKILLSLGGGASESEGFPTTAEARDFALTLWNMFGKGWSYYRPFGEAVVDGFDFDMEHGSSDNYHYLALSLRRFFTLDPSKTYYLTAAPQCPIPDLILNEALTSQPFDAIFVQFYNNPACQATVWPTLTDKQGVAGFNFGAWDAWVKSSAYNKNMKVFVTLPAAAKAAGSGYVSKETAAQIVADMAKRYPGTFGGVGLWDASVAVANTGYIARVKQALNSAEGLKKRGMRWAKRLVE